ncbi:MAG: hypothetical protein HXY22_03490 [Alphaproteobacteria bacterium]|nr:hypothetical protein [Alphaproteobacteria bacterium]
MIRSGLLFVMAFIYALNGARMAIDPEGWYAHTPGVSGTGPFNNHFITDIGFIYLTVAFAFAYAAIRPAQTKALLIFAALWPLLHALFHLSEWMHHGLPDGLALWTESLGVILPSALGAILAATPLKPAPQE